MEVDGHAPHGTLTYDAVAGQLGVNARLCHRLSLASVGVILLAGPLVVVVCSDFEQRHKILPRRLSTSGSVTSNTSVVNHIGENNLEHALRHTNFTASASMSEKIVNPRTTNYVKNLCIQNGLQASMRLVVEQVTQSRHWTTFSQYVDNGDRACLSAWDINRYGTDNALLTCMFNVDGHWQRQSCRGSSFRLSKNSPYTGVYLCSGGGCSRVGVQAPILPYNPGPRSVRSVCLETQGTRKVRLYVRQTDGVGFAYLTNWVHLGTRSCINPSALAQAIPNSEFQCFYQHFSTDPENRYRCIGNDFTFDPNSNDIGIYQCERGPRHVSEPQCQRVAIEGPFLQ